MDVHEIVILEASGVKLPTELTDAEKVEKIKQRRARAPYAQVYDEVRIRTVPRYATSKLFGDEWRISATIELLYKGSVVAGDWYKDVASAIAKLPVVIDNHENGYSDAESEKDKQHQEEMKSRCDQEGCSEPAITWLKIVKRGCTKCGEDEEMSYQHYRPMCRAFCARHVIRGNCSLDDADDCYEYLAGEPLEQKHTRKEDESPAATVFVNRNK